MKMKKFLNSAKGIIQSLGLVFGDIGTSPIYTFTVIFLIISVQPKNIIGILSVIIWSLILIVSIQYSVFAMSFSKHGEGGAIVLNRILRKFLKKGPALIFFTYLAYIEISLFIGDSVITPAISILSAVEGLKLIDVLHNITQADILFITLIITIILFWFQHKGTEKITSVFGPIMMVWFIVLFVSGVISIHSFPVVLKAFNPMYGIDFITHNGVSGFFILSEIVLCVTGAEALYTDMGHLGRGPITKAWCLVFVALVANYLGQGAFLATHPESKNILFEMINSQSKILYIPFLFVSIMATIIASQAVISGFFSVVYQGINTGILPLFRVSYTSEKINSQIYINSANWFLMIFAILIILVFKESSRLASAYGLTVTCTFVINSITMALLFFIKKEYFKFSSICFLVLIDLAFMIAAFSKIKYGAYWSIIISMLPLTIMILYTKGQGAIRKKTVSTTIEEFCKEFKDYYEKINKVKGTALFFSSDTENISRHIVKTMFVNNIIYTNNIIVQIIKTNEAFGISHEFENLSQGLSILRIYEGYMEKLNLEEFLAKLNIDEKVIFYGIYNIETRKVFWRIYSLIRKISPTFVNFYKLPLNKVCGVITHVKL